MVKYYGKKHLTDPFQANVPFLYPLKLSENFEFSDVFRDYAKDLKWVNLVKVKLNEFRITKIPG